LNYIMRITFFVLFLIFISDPALPQDEQLINILQGYVNEVINILNDPICHGAVQKNDLQKIRLKEIALEIFDFEKFCLLVLDSSRSDFNHQQKKEFVDVFSGYLIKYYLKKIQKKYNDEKIMFLRQEIIGGSNALIKVKVLWHDLKIPVDIRMFKQNDTWKVYDVVIGGISAVRNYHAQFEYLQLKKTPVQIIDMVKNKMAQ
jgi:phospholipid transport system substrate-binding protein